MSLDRYSQKLEKIEKRGHLRRIREIQGPQGRLLKHAGREYLNFSSNNYLGLAEDSRVREAFARGIESYGTGSGAARLINGSMTPFHELERALAEFKGAKAALLFNSGYLANVGCLSALVGEGDVIFSDELNHASMIDGIRLSRAKKILYAHNDPKDLREKVREVRERISPGATLLIATESVFSMDGDLCSVAELLEIAEEFDALLYLDEAHATGIFGEGGAGLAEALRDKDGFGSRLIQMGTLGKAIGCFGAYVAGARVLIDYLINSARTFIFSTALPPALATATLEALKIVQEEAWRREQLMQNLRYFAEEWERNFPKCPLKIQSPIIPILIGEEAATVSLSESLREKGLWVSAIRPPTVPAGTSRLRITLMATHTKEDIKTLMTLLREGI